jgi:adenylate kinase
VALSAIRAAFVVGKPGAGKGTQAALLAAELGIRHISMGSLLRDASARQAGEGDHAPAEAMSVGALVPQAMSRAALLASINSAIGDSEDVVIEGVRRATSLGAGLCALSSTAAIAGAFIDVPDDVVRDRLRARRYCAICHVSYGLLNPPQSDGHCSYGHELTRRADDHDAAIEARLEVFRHEEPRLIEVASSHLFFRANGNRPPPKVFAEVMAGLLQRWDTYPAQVPGEASF